MKKPLLLLCAMTSLWMIGAQASPILYSAVLSGANEAPPNASPGTGTGTVKYDPIAHTMLVEVDFSGLIGNTTVAHIHCCALPGSNAGVATPVPTFPGFPAGVTSGTYMQLFDLTLSSSFNPTFITNNGGTLASAEAALATGLADGKAYYNIHTSAFPGGEIRGNLAAVSEPATWSLLGFGLAVWMTSRRTRRPGTAERS